MRLTEALKAIEECDLPYTWTLDDGDLHIKMGESHFLFGHAKRGDIESGRYTEKDLVLFCITTYRADINIDAFKIRKCSVENTYFIKLFREGIEIGDLIIEVEPAKCILEDLTILIEQGEIA